MTMRAIFVLALAVASMVAAAPAAAQTPPPPEPPPAEPPPPPEEPRVAEGVTVARIPVGGMTAEQARAAIKAGFDRPVPLAFRAHRWRMPPAKVGATPYLSRAVTAALAAAPGRNVALDVRINNLRVERYIDFLDRRFSRPAKNSVLSLRNLRPFLTKAQVGWKVRQLLTRRLLYRALRRTERDALVRVPATKLPPRVHRGNYGPIVVIRRGSRRLYLYRNMAFVRSFRIAVGMPAYPTPLGRFHVVSRERHPTWDPPNSPWAAGLGPVPPGPGNPLGTRWIGTSAPAIGIHGTPQPWTVGTAASHGCIRMYMSEVEWLFERVRVGSPVFIVRA